MRPRIATLVLMSACFSFAARAAAEETHPARLISSTAVAYAELSRPGQLLDLASDPKLLELVRQAEPVEQYLESDAFRSIKQVVRQLEEQLEAPWRVTVGDLTGGGVYAAFEPLSQGAVIIVKSRDAKLLARAHQALLELIQTYADENGRESPVKSQQYRGVTGWRVGDGYHTIVDDLLILSNKVEVLKGAIDRHQGRSRDALTNVPAFQQAQQAAPKGATGWGMLRLAPLRLLPGVTKALSGPSDNPGIEVLAGGILDAAKDASFVAFDLQMTDDEVRWRARLPHDRAKVAENRHWYFAPTDGKSSYAPLRPPGTVATLTAHRDLSGMWLAREELFDEETVAQLTQADAGLGLYFKGDFGADVLGQLSPRIQFVAVRQEFAAGQPVPAVKLPAFAGVLEIDGDEQFATQLLLAYQNIVGIVNITGIQAGRAQLLQTSEEYRGVRISKAEYVPDAGIEDGAAGIAYNFSPACAQVGDRFILGSTASVVRALVDELQKPDAERLTADNALLELDLQQLGLVLADNRETLIAQNMLEDGNTREEAEGQISLLLDVLRLMRKSSLRLVSKDGSLHLAAALGLPKP